MERTLDYSINSGSRRRFALLFLVALVLFILQLANMQNIVGAQEENQAEIPQPQTPAVIESAYNDQMTPEQASTECERVGELIGEEFDRLIESIRPFEISHPDYYVGEATKIDAWFTAIATEQSTECQTQLDKALDRQLPASQTPGFIEVNYHDQMTVEEVDQECIRVNQSIEDELDHLLENIQPFADSHPDYYDEEETKIKDWLDTITAETKIECQAQRETALDRQQTEPDIDALYPHISQEIKDLAERLELTDAAKIILYDNNPLLFDDPDHPDFTCDDEAFAEVYIYGCWEYQSSIKLLRDNSTAITLAHELLHAVYYDYYVNYQNDLLDNQIDIVTFRNPLQTQIILDAYTRQIDSSPPNIARYIRYTELHSFIGTQFTSIPQDLEDHYGQYFEDRQAIVNIFHDWVIGTRAKFTEREENNQKLLRQIDEYLECLDDPYAIDIACQKYQPNNDQYSTYDNCLASRKTFVQDCQHLQPQALILYEPTPAPLPAIAELTIKDPDVNNDNLQEQIEEIEELAEQVNEQQSEIEESFVHQLVFYDHDLEDPAPETHGRDNNAADDNSENDDTADPTEAEAGAASQSDDDNNRDGESDNTVQSDVASTSKSIGGSTTDTIPKKITKTRKNQSYWVNIVLPASTTTGLIIALIVLWRTSRNKKEDTEDMTA